MTVIILTLIQSCVGVA